MNGLNKDKSNAFISCMVSKGSPFLERICVYIYIIKFMCGLAVPFLYGLSKTWTSGPLCVVLYVYKDLSSV